LEPARETAEHVIPESGSETVPEPAAETIVEQQPPMLMPPEASEEPDLNVPALPLAEAPPEPEHHE
jgi:hypothetical protein